MSTTFVLWLFGFAFASDLARAIFEVLVNFRYRGRTRQTVELGRRAVAIVIPCHDSADCIEATLRSLPPGYTVYCVANNCTDNTAEVVSSMREQRPEVQLIDVDYPELSKTKAVLLGAIQAKEDGFGHFLLLDDDALWPAERPIEVLRTSVAVTALPLIPERPTSLLQSLQIFEYIGTNLNKRCQTFFAADVTWASGAAAIFRVDVFLDVMRMHDGEFAGEDVQCSYLHHYRGHSIDFLPRTMVVTEVPRTLPQWWRQRAHSWDVSFMFLHIGLLLRVLFQTDGKGPGWWIRLLTFYRIYDSLLVLVKLALPLAILRVPTVTLLFLGSSYMVLTMQYLSYPVFFAPLARQHGGVDRLRMGLAFLLFPAYQFMTWVSRLTALPRVIRLKLNPRELLGQFVDDNFAACTRVSLTRVDRPGRTPPRMGSSRRPKTREQSRAHRS